MSTGARQLCTGRPSGEIRQVIAAKLREAGPLPLREIAERTQVGHVAAGYTVKNMMRAGALQIVGHVKSEHARKWPALYDLAAEAEQAGAGEPRIGHSWAELFDAMRGWQR